MWNNSSSICFFLYKCKERNTRSVSLTHLFFLCIAKLPSVKTYQRLLFLSLTFIGDFPQSKVAVPSRGEINADPINVITTLIGLIKVASFFGGTRVPLLYFDIFRLNSLSSHPRLDHDQSKTRRKRLRVKFSRSNTSACGMVAAFSRVVCASEVLFLFLRLNLFVILR